MASIEINELISKHPLMDLKQAVKLLYQPGYLNICYDINNFNFY